jgi:hypothetical protein
LLSIFAATSSILLLTSGGREFVVGDDAGEGVGSLKTASPKKKKTDRTTVTRAIEMFFIGPNFPKRSGRYSEGEQKLGKLRGSGGDFWDPQSDSFG